MSKKILIDAVYPNETRVVLLNKLNDIEEIEYQTANKQQIKGNIYLAKIIRIEPSLQAAFIDYGCGKNGFLPFNEIHPSYYQVSDAEKEKIRKNLEIGFKAITPPEITPEDLKNKNKPSHSFLKDEDEISISIDDIDDVTPPSDMVEEIHEEIFEKSNNDTTERSEFVPIHKQYKIQEVLKKGQVILVQAQKEERGNKGASFTSFISLAGKYCVLMPNKANQNGISRRINHADERNRLKTLIDNLMTQEDKTHSSIIIRTAGISKSSYEIKRDYDYLARLWNLIRETTLTSNAPCFIHMEDDIIQKTIRDMYDHNVSEIIIQGAVAYKQATKFMANLLPSDVKKIKEHKANSAIFNKYNIESQLSSLYQPISSMPSGGYIVINPTEALISIDVNSGKSTSEKDIEETAFKTNLEATKEIARQLKLRDLSGLIVIDFIDMFDLKYRRIVEKTLKEYLKRDKARIQVGVISSFGLLEMSRQRLRPSFLESNSVICNQCNGKGIIRADESNAMLILRTLENELGNKKFDQVNIYASSAAVLYILNHKREEIKMIEEKYNLKVFMYQDHNANSDSFSIETVKLKHQSDVVISDAPAVSVDKDLYNSNEANNNGNDEVAVKDSSSKKKWKSRKNNTRNKKTNDAEDQLTEEPKIISESNASEANNTKTDTNETSKTTPPNSSGEAKLENSPDSHKIEKESMEETTETSLQNDGGKEEKSQEQQTKPKSRNKKIRRSTNKPRGKQSSSNNQEELKNKIDNQNTTLAEAES